MPLKPPTVVDDESCEFGDEQVRREARVETRIRARAGIGGGHS
jgi:hypothetical protein